MKKELIIKSNTGKDISFDISYPDKGKEFPVVLFCHGFKGFKDWGANNWIAEQFVNNGLCIVKINFSHNGIGGKDLSEFTDIELFGQNTIEKELEDIQSVKEELKSDKWRDILDLNNLSIVGHSRGGATAFISAVEDDEFKKIASWSTISNLSVWVNKFDLDAWKNEGKIEFENSRTKQTMFLNYSFYQDVMRNSEKYDILKRCDEITIPVLLLHGENDEAVDLSESRSIYDFIMHSIFIPIENANHTFGVSHPQNLTDIPSELEEVVENTIEFIID